jgi:hypothetical protein
LDLPFSRSKQILEDLFAVTRTIVNHVIKQNRPLLRLIGHDRAPTGFHFSSSARVAQFAAAEGTDAPAEIKECVNSR